MIDVVVIAVYFLAQIGIGWYAKSRVGDDEDFTVAGRRLGFWMYGGTLAAVVLGGASTVGGVGLGYAYGLSGMWLVVAIGCGVILVSAVFAARIRRLRIYTVGEMLELRYGADARLMTGLVMCAYTLLICVVSTIACGAVLSSVFGISRFAAMGAGGVVVLLYSMMGGMWSVTLTDIVQFVIKTVGIFLILVPAALIQAGGFSGLAERLPASAFSLTHVGGDAILAYFVTYVLGLVIGQDIWQRIATARNERIARTAGIATGVYCIAYGVAGALVGMCAKAILPNLNHRDDAFPAIVHLALPPGLSGLVVAAALAAIMSTCSGALIAAATVAQRDIVDLLKRRRRAATHPQIAKAHSLADNRIYLLVLGLIGIGLALVVQDIIAALTIAYGILVGGLLVAIVGGILWRRATLAGALAAMAAGVACTVIAMVVGGDIYASAPLLIGVGASFAAFVVVSLVTPRTSADRLAAWNARLSAGADQ